MAIKHVSLLSLLLVNGFIFSNPVTNLELRKELQQTLDAHYWSKKTIKKLRNGLLLDKNSLINQTLDSILIEHYKQEIYLALQAIPLENREAWSSDIYSILMVGLNNFLIGQEGPALMSTFDGSEMGGIGTKSRALREVKQETNNFTTIPYLDPYLENPLANSLTRGEINHRVITFFLHL
ncbi:MAG TPA: hypothetical protein VLB80_00425 [Candidatus Babeliales bacterium]|nr:hypothetical protein [Candidatus Babeliales bacterium]